MKNTLSFLLLFIIIINSSCKKNKPITEDLHCPPILLLTKISGTTSLGSDGSVKKSTSFFSYDSYLRLINIKNGKKSIAISYIDYNPFNIKYSDSTSSIVKLKVIDLQEILSESRPAKEFASYYESDQLVSKTTTNYTYTGGVMTEVRHKLEDNTIVIEKYTFKDGNVETFDNGKGTTYRYKYDAKQNPFAYRLLKYRMGTLDFYSVNTVIETEETKNGVRKTTKNTYTYNQDGYPLTLKLMNSEGTIVADYKFEYGNFSQGCY